MNPQSLPAQEHVSNAAEPAAPTPAAPEAFKGFDRDLKCREYQYEIGKTYKHRGKVEACASGFHACLMPLDTWNYYGPATSRFAVVECGGKTDKDNNDSKLAAAQITIRAELRLPDLIKRAAEWIVEAAKGSIGTGDSGHAAATGDSGHAAATGYRGHAAATGDSGHAAATGDSGHAAATGDSGHAAATGYRGHAAATGDSGHAAATGDSGHAAATGDSGHAAVKGGNAVAVSLGIKGSAQAEPGGAICLAAYDDAGKLVAVRSSLVGENGVEAGKVYRLTISGRFEEV